MLNYKKLLIPVLFLIVLTSNVFASLSFNIVDNQLIITNDVTQSVNKGYWLFVSSPEILSEEGQLDSMTCTSNPLVECYLSSNGGTLNVLAVSPENGGQMPTSVTLTFEGSGTLGVGGVWIQSYDSNIMPSYEFAGNQDVTLDVSSCDTEADTNCDVCVSFSELITFANLWVDGFGPLFQDVIESANRWVSRDKEIC